MLALNASKRVTSEKGNQLRHAGFIPAIIYGKHMDSSLSIKLDASDAQKFWNHNSIGSQFELIIDGETTSVLFKSIQLEAFTNKILHFDFQALVAGELVKTSCPVTILNKEAMVGGTIVSEVLSEIEYEALPKDLLTEIQIDVAELQIGDSVALENLPISKDERYNFITPLDSVIVSVSAPSQNLEADTEEVDADEVPLVGVTEE